VALGDRAPDGPGIYERPRRSFRGLITFWVITVGMVGGGMAYLQYKGPPPPPRKIELPPPAPKLADDLALLPPPPLPIADPDPQLEESSSLGPDRPLPKRGSDGREPAAAYAARRQNPGSLPRIALVVDGVGLDAKLSRQAIALPYQVDLAFTAHAPDRDALTKLGKEAREAGHECLVSIPLSVTGVSPSFSSTDIFASGVPDTNKINLDRALSNVRGCVGATSASDGQTGHEFADSTPASFASMVRGIEERGLLYLDARIDPSQDEPPGPPVSPPLLQDPHLRRVTIAINVAEERDPVINANKIEDNLAILEHQAANSQSAIGLISLATASDADKSQTLKQIADWARALPAHHEFKLVPLAYVDPPPAPPSQPTSSEPPK
jgi:polysaccharide deacetylase 2 family uncharacterized protein YibQ